ncbi:sulfotransferase domain-containing protein [Shimia ponticola]|uniref:sulfotransferase domain-containing protein n=1 Tax=Shimia ponticola TaxID=2582893 RepID=UPI0011BD91BE|nr:sulfotransferase domain-containing protein [Shimia ponticola]
MTATKAPGTTRPRHAAKKMTPGRFICIGTHHKTGTVWMRKVWKKIAADQDIPFFPVYRPRKMALLPETGPAILVNWHSGFPQELMDHPDARFMHIIRDPRDVLLSGMNYHRVAGLGNEKFLREKRDDLGGANYQDYLNSLPDDLARLRFEMGEKHDATIKEMLAWDYKHPHSVELNYEDLIDDDDCDIFRKALTRIAPEGLDIDRAVQTYWDHSLFGGFAKKEDRGGVPPVHVASGKPSRWVNEMPREVAEDYVAKYGNDLKALKYETSLKWVDACIPADDIKMAG